MNVIFDMDGVLLDSERIIRGKSLLAAQELGLTGMEQVYVKCIGVNRAATSKIMKDAYGESFDYEAFRLRVRALLQDEIKDHGYPLKPGVLELLEYLRVHHANIALASSTSRESVIECLSKVNLLSYFPTLICGDMVTHGKPDPEIYLTACKELGVKPQTAYAIEDSHQGILSAYRGGLRPIMVPDLLPATDEMREYSVVVLPSLHEVKAYFEMLPANV